MDMKVDITHIRAGKKWKDPLLNYLEEHLFWISLELQGEIIHDMPTLFAYLVDLKGEFLTCNRQYEKPFGFEAEYTRKKDGTITITVGYSQERLIITEDKPQ